MKKPKFLLTILLLTVFLVGCKKTNETKKGEPANQITETIKKEEAILVLDYGEGEIATYSGVKIDKSATVFSVLEKITKENNLGFKIREYSFGNLVEQIGDKKNTPNLAWIYFVNKKSGEVAADKKEVKDGDIIEWKYTKPIF